MKKTWGVRCFRCQNFCSVNCWKRNIETIDTDFFNSGAGCSLRFLRRLVEFLDSALKMTYDGILGSRMNRTKDVSLQLSLLLFRVGYESVNRGEYMVSLLNSRGIPELGMNFVNRVAPHKHLQYCQTLDHE